jgi:transposase-like protein
MGRVIRGTGDRRKQRVVVRKTGHPAAVRKVRCPHCRLGYAVQDAVNKQKFTCDRCGRELLVQAL